MKALILAFLFHPVVAMRLDLDLDSTPVVTKLNAEALAVEDINLVLTVPVGKERCALQGSSESGYFVTNMETNAKHANTNFDAFYGHHYYNFRSHMKQSPHTIHTKGRPTWKAWHKKAVEYKFYLIQYHGRIQYRAKFRQLPANRQYLLVLGHVEENDDLEDDWDGGISEAKHACTHSDDKITIQYEVFVDIFVTGDDFTTWPGKLGGLGDAQIAYHPDSTVNEREGKRSLSGYLGNYLKGQSRKGYWFLDITFVDRQDKMTGDDGSSSGFTPNSFWGVYTQETFENLEHQHDKKTDLHVLTHFGSQWQVSVSTWCTKLPTGQFWVGVDGSTEEQLPEYNEGCTKVPVTKAPSSIKTTPKAVALNVGTVTIFDAHNYGDKSCIHKTFPVVACGIFPKTISLKPCSDPKHETEG